ncbi:alpha/beta-tubulin-N-acetyltransferase 9 isoform X2 [Denticeps clupeoides]|uniref:alpha/beta-tubulin-N-acetyltransferase 9 isoform X2 n=1 Tax=Denticeps clupeoides TaxID=299321 RepID=UPI0010A5358C|nr:N-acetyltransferase 9 isoform X2 [Denticeps clupeoides]
MRLNENTLLDGEDVVLVPYTAEHVPRYHRWMASPDLQKLTASEPLTLEQEYDMQRSWRQDDDKCTFIILDKHAWADPASREEDCMVGDVNIFLTDPQEPSLAELEIMIAGVAKLGIRKFQAKIGLDNIISIAMFKKFHFQELSVSEVFREITLEMTVDDDVRTTLLGTLTEEEYESSRDGRRAGRRAVSETVPVSQHQD